jgi:ribose transport system substrate-binding protein
MPSRPGRLLSSLGGFTLCLVAGLIGCAPSAPSGGGAGGTVTGHADPVAPAADGKRIILMTNGNSPFWDACRVGMQAAEKEFKLAEAGLTAVLEVNDGTAKGQLDLLRQYGSQSDIVGVAITVTDSENVAIAEELKNLQAKGVVTVIMDSDFKGELTKTREFFIGTNNTNAGKELGKCAAALRKDGGAYATFFGLSGAQNVVERCAGFAEGAGAAFQSKDSLEDNMDRTKAKENVRNALQNHPDIKTLVGIWSYNAPAIVDVVREAGTRKEITIVVTDAEPIAIQEMEGGMIDAMVVQNPYAMGYDSTRLIKALLAKDEATVKEMFPKRGEPGGDIRETGLKVVIPDDSTAITKDLLAPTTELLKLSEFKEWLKKYDLKGS